MGADGRAELHIDVPPDTNVINQLTSWAPLPGANLVMIRTLVGFMRSRSRFKLEKKCS